MKCTDNTDSDSDIIYSQGKLQELKQAQMSTKNAKGPSSKKTIGWNRSKVDKENNDTGI